MSRDVQQGELVVDTLAIANLEQESIYIQAFTSVILYILKVFSIENSGVE